DHSRTDTVDHIGDRLRIGVEQRAVVGRHGQAGRDRRVCVLVEDEINRIEHGISGVMDLRFVRRYGVPALAAKERRARSGHDCVIFARPGVRRLYGGTDSRFWWPMTPVLTRLAPLLLGLAPLLAACGEGAPKQAAPPPPTVTVAKPARQTVTDYDEYVGRFIAVDMVEMRSRVSGYLEKIPFKDGQLVKQG